MTLVYVITVCGRSVFLRVHLKYMQYVVYFNPFCSLLATICNGSCMYFVLFKYGYKTNVYNQFTVAKVIHLMKNLHLIFTKKHKSQKKLGDKLILVTKVQANGTFVVPYFSITIH